MAKYLLAYHGGSAGSTPAEREAVMQRWGAWFGSLGGAVADPGLPFSGRLSTISPGGAVGSAPFGEPVTGYTILEAGDLARATDLAQGCPVLESGGRITVYETADMM
jgi:hypothetical protein